MKTSKILITGGSGLVGQNLTNKLVERGYTNIITKTRQELNLLNQKDVFDFFDEEWN